jgi:outer membrane protein OmpA-like peptidoglycan-associated protein
MKKTAIQISLVVTFLFVCNTIVAAQNCNEAEDLIGLAEKGPPEEMTEEYFKMAEALCPRNAEIYRRIGEYYWRCYTTELSFQTRESCRKNALDFYENGLRWAEGDLLRRMKIRYDELKNNREFNWQAFRTLAAAPAGATGAGLTLKIRFESGSQRLSGAAQSHLDQLGRMLAENKSIRISLEGHTDRSGNPADNQKLSLKRAESAKRYLIEKFKIAPDRVLTSGFGSERPANISDPYSFENRRVEVIKLSE